MLFRSPYRARGRQIAITAPLTAGRPKPDTETPHLTENTTAPADPNDDMPLVSKPTDTAPGALAEPAATDQPGTDPDIPKSDHEPDSPEPAPTVQTRTTFADLGLSESILRAVAEKGYLHPTPIQEQAIPFVLMGRDVLGTAQTGTGKRSEERRVGKECRL